MEFFEYDRLHGHSVNGLRGKFFRLDLGDKNQVPIDQNPTSFDPMGIPLDEDGANPFETGLWIWKDEDANPSTGNPGRTHLFLDGIELGGVWDPTQESIRTLKWGGSSLQGQTVKIGLKAGGVLLQADPVAASDGSTVIDLGDMVTDKTIKIKQNHLVVNNFNGNSLYGDDRTTALKFLNGQDDETVALSVMYDNDTIKLTGAGELYARYQLPKIDKGLYLDADDKLNVGLDEKTIKLNTDNKLYANIDGDTIKTNTVTGQMYVPTASMYQLGVVKVDGDTINIDADGVISSAGSLSNNGRATNVSQDTTTATTQYKVDVKTDDKTISVDADNNLYAIIATTSQEGVVKPDGDTITIETDGTIKSTQIKAGEALYFDTTDKYLLNVKYDDATIKLGDDNQLYARTADSDNIGVVKPDNDSITISDDEQGILSATPYEGVKPIVNGDGDEKYKIYLQYDGNTNKQGDTSEDPTILLHDDGYIYVKTAESPADTPVPKEKTESSLVWDKSTDPATLTVSKDITTLVSVYDNVQGVNLTPLCTVNDNVISISLADLGLSEYSDVKYTYTVIESKGKLGVVIPDGDTITIDVDGVVSSTQLEPRVALALDEDDKYIIDVLYDDKTINVGTDNKLFLNKDDKSIIYDSDKDYVTVNFDGRDKDMDTAEITDSIFYSDTKGLYVRKSRQNDDIFADHQEGTELQPIVLGNVGYVGVNYPDGLTIKQDANGKMSVPITQFNETTGDFVGKTNEYIPTAEAVIKYVRHFKQMSVRVSTDAATTPEGVVWYDMSYDPKRKITGTLKAEDVDDPHVMYLVPLEDTLSGNYVQYITIDIPSGAGTVTEWERLGTTQTDLEDYVHKTNTVAGVPFYNELWPGEPADDKNITSKELEPNLFVFNDALEIVDDASVATDHYTINVKVDDETNKIDTSNRIYTNIDGYQKSLTDNVTLLYDATKGIYARPSVATTYTDAQKTTVLKQGYAGVSYADGKTVLSRDDGELYLLPIKYDSSTHNFTIVDDSYIPSTKAVYEYINDEDMCEPMLECKVSTGRLTVSKTEKKQAVLNRIKMV